MPSNKPRFTYRTEQTVLDKLDYIAKQNKRSACAELDIIVEKYIYEYEQEHGTIEINKA